MVMTQRILSLHYLDVLLIFSFYSRGSSPVHFSVLGKKACTSAGDGRRGEGSVTVNTRENSETSAL